MKNTEILIRVFGAFKCKKCKALVEDLINNNISFTFIDAFANDMQDICDVHNVGDLPHLQIEKNGKIIHESIVDYDIVVIKNFLKA